MLIYVKNIKKKKKNFLRTDRRTDGRTDGQPKTIVRNLTKVFCFKFLLWYSMFKIKILIITFEVINFFAHFSIFFYKHVNHRKLTTLYISVYIIDIVIHTTFYKNLNKILDFFNVFFWAKSFAPLNK